MSKPNDDTDAMDESPDGPDNNGTSAPHAAQQLRAAPDDTGAGVNAAAQSDNTMGSTEMNWRADLEMNAGYMDVVGTQQMPTADAKMTSDMQAPITPMSIFGDGHGQRTSAPFATSSIFGEVDQLPDAIILPVGVLEGDGQRSTAPIVSSMHQHDSTPAPVTAVSSFGNDGQRSTAPITPSMHQHHSTPAPVTSIFEGAGQRPIAPMFPHHMLPRATPQNKVPMEHDQGEGAKNTELRAITHAHKPPPLNLPVPSKPPSPAIKSMSHSPSSSSSGVFSVGALNQGLGQLGGGFNGPEPEDLLAGPPNNMAEFAVLETDESTYWRYWLFTKNYALQRHEDHEFCIRNVRSRGRHEWVLFQSPLYTMVPCSNVIPCAACTKKSIACKEGLHDGGPCKNCAQNGDHCVAPQLINGDKFIFWNSWMTINRRSFTPEGYVPDNYEPPKPMDHSSRAREVAQEVYDKNRVRKPAEESQNKHDTGNRTTTVAHPLMNSSENTTKPPSRSGVKPATRAASIAPENSDRNHNNDSEEIVREAQTQHREGIPRQEGVTKRAPSTRSSPVTQNCESIPKEGNVRQAKAPSESSSTVNTQHVVKFQVLEYVDQADGTTKTRSWGFSPGCRVGVHKDGTFYRVFRGNDYVDFGPRSRFASMGRCRGCQETGALCDALLGDLICSRCLSQGILCDLPLATLANGKHNGDALLSMNSGVHLGFSKQTPFGLGVQGAGMMVQRGSGQGSAPLIAPTTGNGFSMPSPSPVFATQGHGVVASGPYPHSKLNGVSIAPVPKESVDPLNEAGIHVPPDQRPQFRPIRRMFVHDERVIPGARNEETVTDTRGIQRGVVSYGPSEATKAYPDTNKKRKAPGFSNMREDPVESGSNVLPSAKRPNAAGRSKIRPRSSRKTTEEAHAEYVG
ncbi:hypothetical protein K490DRAFT_67125 [Saccharata proteae CBS 121410]|uniref:Uncharacterized protein n=1 Tax=Saccharata proteae CBS 121410 TaxID=1314787 RepID=A0A9P4LU64_9PEZI|nr:hypothetical protein K490DRAFT_67125 [Saccharata proteae CBS 121410]